MKKNINKINKWAFFYTPLIISVYLITMLIGTAFKFSFCSSEGCELAGSLMKISKVEMYMLGLMSISFLTSLGWMFLIKKEESYRLFFIVILSTMIIAETVFLTYMFFASEGKTCIVCLIFYAMLVFNLIFVSRASEVSTNMGAIEEFKKIKEKTFPYALFKIFTGVAAVTIFVSMFLLDFGGASSNKMTQIQEGYSLISSPTCKFCKEIKSDLKEKNISYYDRDAKLNLDFIKVMGGKTIPVLILKEKDEISVFNTFNSIKKHLAATMINEGSNGAVISAAFGSKAISPTPSLSNPFALTEEGPAGCSPTDTAHKTEESCE